MMNLCVMKEEKQCSFLHFHLHKPWLDINQITPTTGVILFYLFIFLTINPHFKQAQKKEYLMLVMGEHKPKHYGFCNVFLPPGAEFVFTICFF